MIQTQLKEKHIKTLEDAMIEAKYREKWRTIVQDPHNQRIGVYCSSSSSSSNSIKGHALFEQRSGGEGRLRYGWRNTKLNRRLKSTVRGLHIIMFLYISLK